MKVNKTLLFALKLTISGSLLYLVLKRAGIGKVFGLLADIDPWSFAAAVAIYLAAQLLSSFRWRLFLQGGYGIRRLYPLYLLGSFFNTFLPGLVGGDMVKAYYLYREAGEGTRTLASVFMDRYTGFVTLMLMGLVAFPFGLKYFRGSWIEWLLPLIVLVFAVLSLVFFGLRLGDRIRFLKDFYGYFHFYRRQRGTMARAVLLSAVVQGILVIAVYILALGLGQRIPLASFFIFIPIVVTMAALPVSISGVGLREAAFVLLFGTVGVRPEAATAISFAWFLSIATGGLAGAYEYLRHKGHGKDLEEDAP